MYLYSTTPGFGKKNGCSFQKLNFIHFTAISPDSVLQVITWVHEKKTLYVIHDGAQKEKYSCPWYNTSWTERCQRGIINKIVPRMETTMAKTYAWKKITRVNGTILSFIIIVGQFSPTLDECRGSLCGCFIISNWHTSMRMATNQTEPWVVVVFLKVSFHSVDKRLETSWSGYYNFWWDWSPWNICFVSSSYNHPQI